ncbi:hypothetical protein EG68_03236 [Paragonimus skrjabini miyazakii]|uniref:Armadillo repeat-containing protein 4 n=1 Tax=Paragonimus skrjabini miyazakii TaxID=59628 RepID=A0A8S9YU59_9TREM|nr:hypothetical protein EG68_03236 [Paragonimus skrjabini miyazakii]
MGCTLSQAAEWTSVRGGSSGKLEYSQINQKILGTITEFLKDYCSKNPDVKKITFKSALRWRTRLSPEIFSENGARTSGVDHLMRPLAAIQSCQDGGYEFIVHSLYECIQIISTAGADAVSEVRACLEANPDPMVNMLGERFSSSVIESDDSVFRYMEEIMNDPEKSPETEQKKMALKVALDFHNLDVKLLNDTLHKIAGEFRLTPQTVDCEISLLHNIVGYDKQKCILEYIRPTGVFKLVHANGCRAPPWRQMYGDIAYYTIKILGADSELSVTAATYGWFLNGGFNQKTGQMNFEKTGETYRDLTALLRANSSQFNTFLNSTDLANLMEPSEKACSPRGQHQPKGREQKTPAQTTEGRPEMNRLKEPGKKPIEGNGKTQAITKHNLKEPAPTSNQPSKRWQIVGLRSSDDARKKATEPSGDQTDGRNQAGQKRGRAQNRPESGKENMNIKIMQAESPNHSDVDWPVVDSNNSTEAKKTSRPSLHKNMLNSNAEPSEEGVIPGTVEQKAEEEVEKPAKKEEKSDVERVASTDLMESTTDVSPIQSKRTRHNNEMRLRQRYTDIITVERLKNRSLHRRVSSGNVDSPNELSSESESDEEEDIPERRTDANTDLPSEYWQIGKMVKYLKGGNQTSTIISLCALQDMPLKTEVCQLAVRDVGGIDILVNLLETDEVRCKLGSLKILREITKNPQIRRAIADIGGLQPLVNLLRSPNRDLKCLSAEVIANVANFHRARRTVRQYGGIKRLVALLDCPSLNSTPMTNEVERDIEVARCGALALWSCSKSRKNKLAMKRAGVISLLARLLKSPHENMLIPVVGTLQECASEPTYRVAIRTEGMIEDLVKNLKRTNPELQMHCASTIYKCAEEPETRDLVRLYGGLEPLIVLLNNQENKELLAAATGAIWKCAISKENIKQFQKLGVIEKLVSLLNEQPEEMSSYLYVDSVSPRIQLVLRTEKVLVNVVGALGEMAKDPTNRVTIRKSGGIAPLVSLLTRTNQELLINTTKAVGKCAEEPESMREDETHVLMTSAILSVRKDAGEMVRSFVGGLELIVSLLRSNDLGVLAAVCAAVSKIAVDEENLAVITDHGVVPLLSRLTCTKDDHLRCPLTDAIARCCTWGTNRIDFGRAGAVSPLVRYLHSPDPAVHRSTARALFQLSRDPSNCVAMHEAGAVKLLLQMVGSQDLELQNAAAGCISNIRRLSLANERAQLKRIQKSKTAAQRKTGTRTVIKPSSELQQNTKVDGGRGEAVPTLSKEKSQSEMSSKAGESTEDVLQNAEDPTTNPTSDVTDVLPE